MGHALVTGANRGIGLEFCRQLARRGDSVVAACRHRSPQLDALGVQVEAGVDVTDASSVTALCDRLKGDTLDLLINNAAIASKHGLDDLDFDDVERQLTVNAVGPLRMTASLLPLMREGSKIIFMTSFLGSIARNRGGGYYGYRMSKAALNAASVSLALDLKPRGISVASLHPGNVETDMLAGSEWAGHGRQPAEAVERLIARIDAVTLETTGRFWHAMTGEELPW